MNLWSYSLPIEWLPRETLYSAISRLHRIAGYSKSTDTTKALFGHSRVGGSPNITTGLDQFVEKTNGALGVTEELAFDRQTAGYFAKFLSVDQRRGVLTAMREPSSAKLVRAQLYSLQAANVLRWCPACRERDEATYRIAYWHLTHQLPCTWVCIDHGLLLNTSEIEGCSSWKTRWVLPDSFSRTASTREPVHPCAKRIASVAAEIWTSQEAVRQIKDISSRGVEFLSDTRTRDLAKILTLLERFVPVDLFKSNSKKLRDGTLALDPNYLPLTIAAAGCTLSEFAVAAAGAPLLRREDQQRRGQRELVIELVRDGVAPSAAAKQAGVDTKTAQIWVSREIGPVSKRPKRVTAELSDMARGLLKAGASKQIVENALEVSPATVNTLMGMEPGLQRSWNEARRERQLQSSRKRLDSLVREHPQLSAKVCRILDPAAYALLYRGDRAWLMQFNSARPRPPTGFLNLSSDDEVVARYVDAADLRSLSHPDISAAEMLRELPLLAVRIAYLLFMPRTQASLRSLAARISDRQLNLF